MNALIKWYAFAFLLFWATYALAVYRWNRWQRREAALDPLPEPIRAIPSGVILP